MNDNSIIARFKKFNLGARKKDRNTVECYDITKPDDAPAEKLTLRAVRAAGRGTFGSVLQVEHKLNFPESVNHNFLAEPFRRIEARDNRNEGLNKTLIYYNINDKF